MCYYAETGCPRPPNRETLTLVFDEIYHQGYILCYMEVMKYTWVFGWKWITTIVHMQFLSWQCGSHHGPSIPCSDSRNHGPFFC
jgi:hypothetical protein